MGPTYAPAAGSYRGAIPSLIRD